MNKADLLPPPHFSPYDEDAAGFITWVEAGEASDCDLDKARYIAGMQGLINSGLAWQLQGSYGRSAMNLINGGVCHPPSLKRKDMH